MSMHKKIKSLLISTLFILVNSCQSAAVLNTSKFTFEIIHSNQKKIFEHELDTDLVKIDLAGTEVYVSNFTKLEVENINNFILKRINSFKNLFLDETNPYTGSTYFKSKCFIKNNEDSVNFYSGYKNIWSECNFKNNILLKENESTRYWKVCGATVWEVTIKSPQTSQFLLNCRYN